MGMTGTCDSPKCSVLDQSQRRITTSEAWRQEILCREVAGLLLRQTDSHAHFRGPAEGPAWPSAAPVGRCQPSWGSPACQRPRSWPSGRSASPAKWSANRSAEAATSDVNRFHSKSVVNRSHSRFLYVVRDLGALAQQACQSACRGTKQRHQICFHAKATLTFQADCY